MSNTELNNPFLPEETEKEKDMPDPHRVTLCPDGKYRWVYELNMYKNPIILFTVWKVLIMSAVIVFLFVNLITLIEGTWEWKFDLSGDAKYALLALLLFFLITIIAYLIVAKQNGGKYIVLFEMDEEQITHRQMQAQFQKAQATSWLLAMAGIATGNASLTGMGLINATRDSMTSIYENVKKVKPVRFLNLIKVNNRFQHNQIYVVKEDFDFVLSYIKDHVQKEKDESSSEIIQKEGKEDVLSAEKKER